MGAKSKYGSRKGVKYSLMGNNMFGDNSILSRIRSNLQFRMTSARGMIAGESEMAPMQRRKEIRTRRMDLFNSVLSRDNSDSSSSPSSNVSNNRISTSTDRTSRTSSTTTTNGVQSMSDVEKGTKKRASERGFSS